MNRPGWGVLVALLLGILGVFAVACGGSDDGPSETPSDAALRVGYFEGWPLPGLVVPDDGRLEAASGGPIDWVEMSSGGAMAVALHQGEIDMGLGHDLAAFSRFATNGFEIRAVGVAVDYMDLSDCLSHPGLLSGPDPVLTRDNAARLLAGGAVYAPYGGMDHYRVSVILEDLGVSPGSVGFHWSSGNVGALGAFNAGEVVVACAFGDRLEEIATDGGSALLDRSSQEALGLRVADLVTTSAAFLEHRPEVVQAFLDHLERSNAGHRTQDGEMLAEIAGASGMETADAARLLDGFRFPSLDEQSSGRWLGGALPGLSRRFMAFLADRDIVPSSLDSYEAYFVTPAELVGG